MIKKPITIHLSTGLEARPVAQLVQVASQFNSEIYVEIGRKKSMLRVLWGDDFRTGCRGRNYCFLQMGTMKKRQWRASKII